MADCRRCIHFIPVDALDPGTLEKALVWVAKHRPGAELKGWCRYYERPITYFTGRCRAFRAKQSRPVKTIDQFFSSRG